MSTGAADADQTLPESLQKLELVPVYERTLALEPSQNPFQTRAFSHRQNDEQVKLLYFWTISKDCFDITNFLSIYFHTDKKIDIRAYMQPLQ